MDAIKKFIADYEVQLKAIIDAIVEFVTKIFNAETEGEFDF